VYTDWR